MRNFMDRNWYPFTFGLLVGLIVCLFMLETDHATLRKARPYCQHRIYGPCGLCTPPDEPIPAPTRRAGSPIVIR